MGFGALVLFFMTFFPVLPTRILPNRQLKCYQQLFVLWMDLEQEDRGYFMCCQSSTNKMLLLWDLPRPLPSLDHCFHVPEQDWDDSLLHKELQQHRKQLRSSLQTTKRKLRGRTEKEKKIKKREREVIAVISWISTTFQAGTPVGVH